MELGKGKDQPLPLFYDLVRSIFLSFLNIKCFSSVPNKEVQVLCPRVRVEVERRMRASGFPAH